MALMLLPSGSQLRYLAVAVFVFWCPGSAVMAWWPLAGRLERSVLSVAVSVSIALVTAEMQAFAGLWSPDATIGVLAALTTAAVFARHLPTVGWRKTR